MPLTCSLTPNRIAKDGVSGNMTKMINKALPKSFQMTQIKNASSLMKSLSSVHVLRKVKTVS